MPLEDIGPARLIGCAPERFALWDPTDVNANEETKDFSVSKPGCTIQRSRA